MNKFSKITILFLMNLLIISAAQVNAERIRFDRKHGEVNAALQEMLSKQVSTFSGGVGKIDLGREGNSKSSCVADLFVSPDTVYVVVESSKNKGRSEFYVDHPDDSFKDILFQALVKLESRSELSVDKKSGGYKFISDGDKLSIEVKQKGDVIECEFDLSKSILLSGETE